MTKIPKQIFKDCDIRGIFDRELTPEIAYSIGRALGVKLTGKSVVVGGDVRVHTPPLKEQIQQALLDSGCTVLDIGIVPTPVFHFVLQKTAAEGGVIVTASHNRPEFNGFKLVIDKMPTIREDIDELIHLVETRAKVEGKGHLEQISLLNEYQQELLARWGTGKGVKVVVDSGNGAYSEIAPNIFRQSGYEVVELFCRPDGRFPSRDPNTAIPEYLSALTSTVTKEKADLGVAFDGDGDRVAFVDEQGRVIPAEQILVLFVRELLQPNSRSKVVCDIKASKLVEDEVLALGCVFLEEKSGHAYIKKRMITENAELGGEISGHFFYQELGGGDDGLYAALLLGKILQEKQTALSHLIANLPRYHTTPDLRIPYHGEDQQAIIEQLIQHFQKYKLTTIDGVKVDFGYGWGLLRTSVTEPAITLRFECVEGANLPSLAEEFLQPIPEIRQLVSEQYPKVLAGEVGEPTLVNRK